MKKNPLVLVIVLLVLVGAGIIRRSKSEDPTAPGGVPETPKQAATQLERVFAQAPPEIKQAAASAAEAMRQNDYEKAVVSLAVVRQQPTPSVEQGMAVHYSMVNMEGQLIKAMENGDPNAKRAYEILRKSKSK